MSTTFYLKHIPTQEEKENIISNINCNELEYALRVLKASMDKIKFGIRKHGWRFKIYLHNEKYYKPTIESITNFAKENNYIVEDEYGNKYTIDEFWAIVINGWDIDNIETSETYYSRNTEIFIPMYSNYSYSYWTQQGFIPNTYGEFINDGILFDICDS